MRNGIRSLDSSFVVVNTEDSLTASGFDVNPMVKSNITPSLNSNLTASGFEESAINLAQNPLTFLAGSSSVVNVERDPLTATGFVTSAVGVRPDSLTFSGRSSDVVIVVKNDPTYDPANEVKPQERRGNFVANAYEGAVQVSDYLKLMRNIGYSAGFIAVAGIAIYANPVIALTYGVSLASTALVDRFYYKDENYTHLKAALTVAPALLLLAVPATYGLILPIVPVILNPLMNPDFGSNVNRFISAFNLLANTENRIVNLWNFATGSHAALTSAQAVSALTAAVAVGYLAPCFQKDIVAMGRNISEESRTLLKNYVYGIGENVFNAGKTVVDTTCDVAGKCKASFQQREKDRRETEAMGQSWILV